MISGEIIFLTKLSLLTMTLTDHLWESTLWIPNNKATTVISLKP